MKYFLVVFFCVALTTSYTTASPSKVNDNFGSGLKHGHNRYRREIPDECRMHFPRPPHHRDSNEDSTTGESRPTPPPPPPVCCELPDLMSTLDQPEIFVRCHRYVHDVLNLGSRRSHHRFLGHGSHHLAVKSERVARDVDESDDNNKESHIDRFQEKKECFMSCVFNSSGLTNDDAFNEELLMKKLSEAIGNETKWSPIFDPVYKKCLAAAKEANSQSQKTCKAGPAEYIKCFTRELFFNCPSDVWTNNPGCTEFKEKLEKCPNLMPFPPHRPHRSHGHHRHHHYHHHGRPAHTLEKRRIPIVSEEEPEER